MIIFFWKGKGILVPAYTLLSLATVAILGGVLHRNVGGIFARAGFYPTMGIGFLIAAIWTYLTKNDYYKDRQGVRKKMDTVNAFFFIKMKYWAFILAALSLLFLGNSIFHYFDPIS